MTCPDVAVTKNICVTNYIGRMTQMISRWLRNVETGLDVKLVLFGFSVDKVTPGQIDSELFVSPVNMLPPVSQSYISSTFDAI